MPRAADSGSVCTDCGAWRGALGLEPTPDLFVEHIVEVFRQVRRVLRADGTVWLNLGDSYATLPGKGANVPQTKHPKNDYPAAAPHRSQSISGLKPKDLCMMPARVALALQADGWWLRSEIVWAKPNPMPESVTDRPTSAHEKVFLLTQSGAPLFWTHPERAGTREQPPPDYRWIRKRSGAEVDKAPSDPENWTRRNLWRGRDYFYDADAVREAAEYGRRNWNGQKFAEGDINSGHARTGGSVTGGDPQSGRNLRNVWTIATAPFPEAHFATFPPALVEPCIKAGTSEKGVCPACGAPWAREVETKRSFQSGSGRSGNPIGGKQPAVQGAGYGDMRMGPTIQSKTTGWRPSCECDVSADLYNAPPVFVCDLHRATVLDPFGGAGTTGLCAERLGRSAVLIEANPEYAAMAARRIRNDALLLADVKIEDPPAKPAQPALSP